MMVAILKTINTSGNYNFYHGISYEVLQMNPDLSSLSVTYSSTDVQLSPSNKKLFKADSRCSKQATHKH